jgi:hypothetical protein
MDWGCIGCRTHVLELPHLIRAGGDAGIPTQVSSRRPRHPNSMLWGGGLGHAPILFGILESRPADGSLTGPQMRGTGGTLMLFRKRVKTGATGLPHRSPNARDRWHPHVDWKRVKTGATGQLQILPLRCTQRQDDKVRGEREGTFNRFVWKLIDPGGVTQFAFGAVAVLGG